MASRRTGRPLAGEYLWLAPGAPPAKPLRDSGYEVSPDDILVTNGGKQAGLPAFAAPVQTSTAVPPARAMASG